MPEMTNVHGEHTNAIYGFLNIMFRFLDEEKPDHICVAFDVKAKTFRHEMYEAYKGTRKPMPAELHEQVPMLKDLLHAMNIVTVEHPGWEADDILGSLARKAEKEGFEVSLVSGDRDLLQIATDKIKICIPKTKGGKTETVTYYASDVLSTYQLKPSGIIDLKALMGDSSDNIPGVPKVGEKTAISLLVSFGDLDGVYEHLGEITKPALHRNLEENKELAYLSKELATIKTDCDTGVTMDDLQIGDFFNDASRELFVRHGFKSLMKYFDSKESVATTVSRRNIHIIQDTDEGDNCFARLEEADRISIYSRFEKDELIGIGLCDGKDTYVFLCFMMITEPYLYDKISGLVSRVRTVYFDIKKWMSYVDSIDIDRADDVLIGAYLNNPLKSDYEIEDVANEYLDMPLLSSADIFGKTRMADCILGMQDKISDFIGIRAEVLWDAMPLISGRIAESKMEGIYRDIELPLCRVLHSMEKTGIKADRNKLEEYGRDLNIRITELEKAIYELAGTEFNIQSPKQLGEILFEKLGLTGGKKTKSGYSTAADVLEKLAPDNEIVKDILEYRGLSKLKSTYADGLAACIREDGRIHTTFNQTVTATGRISSTEPNLQNIPIRTEQGRLIRKCFVPKDGYVFLDADYSQIELRLLAHMSGDEELIKAYKSEADIHRLTASRVFGVSFEEVTASQRRDAKAVNFGLVYGISSFGLSQDLGISRKEAMQYIEDYFKTYPGVKSYLDNCVRQAVKDGYVTTEYGRRRPIPELKNSNYMVRQFGERVAMNSPLQGTAADIMKIAMIDLYKEIKESGIDADILIQVHDELLLEVAVGDLDRAKEILGRCMVNAARLKVDLEVDIHDGSDWYEVK